jgi:sec-independent protein translocase protein TatC
VDRPARPKDDLFENSTMTFGEHLDELRKAMGKALVWLAIGLVLGLAFFANRVVRYVQEPLKDAIQQFNADRDLARLGFDPSAEDVAPLRQLLTENGLMWELIYDVPDEMLTQFGLGQPRGTAEVVPQTPQPPAAAAGGETTGAAQGAAAPATGEVPKDGTTAAPATAAPAEATEVPPAAAANGVPSGAATAEPSAVASGVKSLPVGPIQMVELLKQLPNPEDLRPRLQLRRHEIGLSALKVEEPFMIWVKAGLIVGAVLASPGIFYHLWSFVAAGLHAHERKYVYVYLPISIGLFVSGVVLAFFFVLYYVLEFLLTFNGQLDVAVEPRLSYYINFVLLLPLGFGLAFQLPLVMVFLERIGLFTVEAYISSWRIAILVIAVISMMVTPADLTSMFSLMIPLIFLYFFGVLMCKYMPKGRGLGGDAYDPV